jgi:hypothetical protein
MRINGQTVDPLQPTGVSLANGAIARLIEIEERRSQSFIWMCKGCRGIPESWLCLRGSRGFVWMCKRCPGIPESWLFVVGFSGVRLGALGVGIRWGLGFHLDVQRMCRSNRKTMMIAITAVV